MRVRHIPQISRPELQGMITWGAQIPQNWQNALRIKSSSDMPSIIAGSKDKCCNKSNKPPASCLLY